jgi:hypothetical protein
MNNKISIFIAVTIGLSILTTSISVNSAIAKEDWGFGGLGCGGMVYGGARSVIQEPVDTGNPQLFRQSN